MTIDIRPIICHVGKFAFIPIAKNGCTGLKRLVLDLDYPNTEITIGGAHSRFYGEFHRINSFKLIPNKYTTFAVWRDPLDRARSLYLNKWIPNKASVQTRIDDKINTFIAWLNYPAKEDHFSHQRIWVFPQYLDYYVNLVDLDNFIDKVFPFSNKIRERNSSSSDFQFTDEQKERIKSIYTEDYALKEFINYEPEH
jgi:hypothetical protein